MIHQVVPTVSKCRGLGPDSLAARRPSSPVAGRMSLQKRARLVLTSVAVCCGFSAVIVGLSMLSAFGLAAIRPENSLQVAGVSLVLLLVLVWLTNGFPEREDICPQTRQRISVALSKISSGSTKPLPDMARGP